VLRGLFSFPSQFKRYDGTKLSALYIIHSVLKKSPEPLRIQIELGADEDLASTTAGQELIEDVNEFIRVKQSEDQRIRREIAAARRAKDKDKVAALDAELAALGPVLNRLKAEQDKVEAPVNWEQAEIDNMVLDRAVMQRHELVTTDWKAKYDELLVEHNQSKASFLLTMLIVNQGTT
jgi:predicted oxidoreductase